MRSTDLRRAGWILAILGLGAAMVIYVFFTWFSRKNDETFNSYVGWANILSMTLGAIGVILLMADKVGAISDLSPERISWLADDLLREAIRQDGLLLARLLSTEVLDSRPATAYFQIEKTVQSQKSGKTRSASLVKKFDEIVDYYSNETDGRLVILGAPGTGKTVLAVTLTVGLLERRIAASSEERQRTAVPCLLYLPSWDPTSLSLEDWLRVQVADRFRLNGKVAERLVRDQYILPVLDGLDEMDSHATNSGRSGKVVAHINDYIAQTPGCRIIVACRSGVKYYESLVRRVSNAREVTVQNLMAAEMVDYIRLQCPDNHARTAWQPVIDALKGHAPGSVLVLSELNSPWRLGAAVMFVRRGGSPESLLPRREEITTRTARLSYSDRVGKLLMESLIFARIAIYSKKQESTTPTVKCLKIVAILLTEMEKSKKGGAEIILHEWWQAFEERKVGRVQLLVMWSGVHLCFGALGFLPFAATKSDHGLFSFFAICVNYLTIQMFCYQAAATRKGPIALHIASLRTSKRALLACVGFFISGLLGWGSSIAFGPLYGVGMGAASAALMLLITASSGLDPVDATRPIATLINDRNFAITIGFAIGGYTLLYYVELYGLGVALSFSSMCVIGAILSSSYTRYLVSTYFGAKRGLPFRFAHFLDACHSAGILRLSGAGYQFRHRELLDYLVENPTD